MIEPHQSINAKEDSEELKILGCVHRCQCSLKMKNRNNSYHMLLTESFSKGLKISEVFLNGSRIDSRNINVILYDPFDIWNSELIDKKFVFNNNTDFTDSVSYFVHRLKLCNYEDRRNLMYSTITKVLCKIIGLIIFMLQPIKYLMSNIQNVLITKVNYTSKFLQQMTLRLSQLEEAKLNLQRKSGVLLSGRIIGVVICDILLGIGLMSFISHFATVEDVYDQFRFVTKVFLI